MRPLTRSLRRSLLQLTAQWKGNGLECLAYGYRPLSLQQLRDCLHMLDEHSVFVLKPETIIAKTSSLAEAQMGNPKSIAKKELESSNLPFIRSAVKNDHCYLTSHNSDKQWHNIRIFPGPRSSIGAVPQVQFDPTTSALSNFSHAQTMHSFIDYNNCVVAGNPLQPRLVNALNESLQDCFGHLLDPDRVVLSAANVVGTTKGNFDPTKENLKLEDPEMASASVVQRLIGKQIFLGMIALRLSTPQELAARVHSFHEVRAYVFFLQEYNPLTFRQASDLFICQEKKIKIQNLLDRSWGWKQIGIV